jgi:hypothetical protein
MEKNVTVRNQQGSELILSDRCKEIIKIVAGVNDCVGFKLEYDELVSWGADVNRLIPDLEIERLMFLMDCFKMDKIEYDKNKGIQNIFNGLRLIERTETGFKILRTI